MQKNIGSGYRCTNGIIPADANNDAKGKGEICFVLSVEKSKETAHGFVLVVGLRTRVHLRCWKAGQRLKLRQSNQQATLLMMFFPQLPQTLVPSAFLNGVLLGAERVLLSRRMSVGVAIGSILYGISGYAA